MRSRRLSKQIFSVLLVSVVLTGCREMMTPSAIPPPPGRIVYTKVDLGELVPITAGSVKLVNPSTLEETELGDGMIRSKSYNGRIAWARKNAPMDWSILVSDADGANAIDLGQFILLDPTDFYGDGPVLSPSLDRVALTMKEVVEISSVLYPRWQTYILEANGKKYLSGDLFLDGGTGKKIIGQERDVMPAFSPGGEAIMKFTWVDRGHEPKTPAYWIQTDAVQELAWGEVSEKTWFWDFEGQENGDGFNAQEYGLMQAQWGPQSDLNEGTATFSISREVFYCTYHRSEAMEWEEIGMGAWPDFSHDGSTIAYASMSGDILVYSAETHSIVETFSPPVSYYFAYPQWSANGATILCTMFDEPFDENENKFTSTGRLVLIDVESSSIIEVNQDPAYRGYWVE